jgi:hypothetical protein
VWQSFQGHLRDQKVGKGFGDLRETFRKPFHSFNGIFGTSHEPLGHTSSARAEVCLCVNVSDLFQVRKVAVFISDKVGKECRF